MVPLPRRRPPPMNKMAVFVEGYTEVVFIDKLIQEIADKNAVLIEWRQITGGTNCPRWNHQIRAAGPNTGQQHFVRGNPRPTAVNRLRGPLTRRGAAGPDGAAAPPAH